MEEKLCSPETSLQAKEKGFNIPQPKCCVLHNERLLSELLTDSLDDGCGFQCYQPTQTILQKWLRDNYDIFVSVQRVPTGSDEWEFSYIIEYLPQDKRDVKRRCPEFRYNFTSQRWNDWEDALEEGLKEGLKLI